MAASCISATTSETWGVAMLVPAKPEKPSGVPSVSNSKGTVERSMAPGASTKRGLLGSRWTKLTSRSAPDVKSIAPLDHWAPPKSALQTAPTSIVENDPGSLEPGDWKEK